MKLYALPPGVAALPALAAFWRRLGQAAGTAVHDGLILLPTRRAARGLAASFLRAAGEATLLPRIVALGAMDEAPLALAGALDLPPAIGTVPRQAVLTRLILARGGAGGAPTAPDAAWALAGELAALMDEAELGGLDLRAALGAAAEGAHAAHWTLVLDFLRIVTDAWPAYLAEQGLINPAARQVALIEAQTAAWAEAPPATPVLAVASAADIPALTRLLATIARLPHGAVVLPGFDPDLPDDVWAALDQAHPADGTARLLADIGARRDDVVLLNAPAPPYAAKRAEVLRRALLPAPSLAAWQTPFAPDLAGLSVLSAADQAEEAACIALVLRGALETPGATAALVTPDRALATRVAAELLRWGVIADDSAGEPLADTPPAVFLRLLAEAARQDLAPVALLALLKHPFAAGGLAPAAFRRAARLLEVARLRGPAPKPGLAALRRSVAQIGDAATGATVADVLARLETCLDPLLRAMRAAVASPAALMTHLVQAAEALAGTDTTAGPAILWAMEEGEALAARLAELIDALPVLPEAAPACLPGLLAEGLRGAVVRSRRAIRGREGLEHPRVQILGLLEARLQTADVLVLGGLSEGVWPQASDPGPWMSRAMRARAGFPSPEAVVGRSAQDFWQAALAAPRVVLAAPRRRDGAPALESRWLVRLRALLGTVPEAPEGAWVAALDRPERLAPAPRPAPCPKLDVRPRRLSVTEIATLRTDPYAIYARHVLRLDPLRGLEEAADAADFGTVVHRGLHDFLKRVGAAWPADAVPKLTAALLTALRAAEVRPELEAWWTPRLELVAQWVDEEERRRRSLSPVTALVPERRGEWHVPAHGGFTLVGRADRIERHGDTLAILDYKTGTVPGAKDVATLDYPQLPLEGAMAEAGAFGPDWQGTVTELTYWRLAGDHRLGTAQAAVEGGPENVRHRIGDATDMLNTLIETFADPDATYKPAPLPEKDAPAGYAHLARTAEWRLEAEPDDSAEDGR